MNLNFGCFEIRDFFLQLSGQPATFFKALRKAICCDSGSDPLRRAQSFLGSFSRRKTWFYITNLRAYARP